MDSNFECVPISEQYSQLDNEITLKMVETPVTASSSNYTASYNVTKPGRLTVSVMEFQQQTLIERFNNANFQSASSNTTGSSITYNWGHGSVLSLGTDNKSLRFKFYLSSSESKKHVIYLTADEYATLHLYEKNLTLNSGLSSVVELESNHMYKSMIEYVEETGTASLHLKWSTDNAAMSNIPSSSFLYPTALISTQNVTINCPVGYNNNFTTAKPSCVEICGDSLLVGGEQCDDGNLLNSDGCSSS